MRNFVVAASLVCVNMASEANLITNPSNELPLVSGEIPGWTEVVGSNWTQRSANPSAYDGSFYFFSGVGAFAILGQNVDVSSFASGIDAGKERFDFSGRVRTFPQTPSDTARIMVRFLDSSFVLLGGFDSGQIVDTDTWKLVSYSTIAPIHTRIAQIELISLRNAGSNNDGYFDDLSLTTQLVVPEPASVPLIFIGLLGAASARRRCASNTTK